MSKDATPLLKVSGLCKRFGSVQALSDVSFELRAGEIHSLLGENGAGKSTTIKCITGVHRPESGTVELNGREIAPRSPREAELSGIGTVYQEVNLLPNLSVLENIVLGRVKTGALGRIDWKDARRRAKAALGKLEMDIDLEARLSSLPVAMQQLVALARALEVDSKVLILDEPTASLDEAEVENLFRVMNLLRDKGIGIIFITHFLDQVFRMSDRMTVLRNGRYIVTRDAKGLSKQDLLQDMLGKAFEEMQSRGAALDAIAEDRAGRATQLQVRSLGAPGKIDSLELELREGEVVGLAGLLGSGRTECARLIFGVDKATAGSLELKGKQVKQGVPSESIREGIMLASEDRKAEGIFPHLTVRENMMIALQSRRGALNPVSREEQDAIAEKYIKAMRIKTSGPEAKIKELSGGNQQKVLLARWLAAEPKVLILDEPTRGIDIGARAEIEKLIESLSEDGLSMIMISSEMDEEVRCCHRVLVLRDRKVIGELRGSAITESAIVRKIADHE
ncbi:sugar ABC transporter ATP-binding protein [Pelagicoccus sp. SDUM812005]|uniref:sugar ABC transporter ATP-binding protein n=1 Tax=Pelagicoccus sp. SDUM812005 TaxID=3041257 RepID=UPI00280FF4D2|nr:sugar ABC transporter ATP-binding protein [Pelagicoccus sp. SDUM812005]MDQ8180057.1 sugar ABC transporter ATP-binding protein [Pelagicoccus sp. SDUM812005]